LDNNARDRIDVVEHPERGHPLTIIPRRCVSTGVSRFPAMREIQASEAKTYLPQLLDDVERGETLVITRHGSAIARKITVEELVAAKQEHKY
jgi:prevent-host-death family protein